jgi:hypothetical protein
MSRIFIRENFCYPDDPCKMDYIFSLWLDKGEYHIDILFRGRLLLRESFEAEYGGQMGLDEFDETVIDHIIEEVVENHIIEFRNS